MKKTTVVLPLKDGPCLVAGFIPVEGILIHKAINRTEDGQVTKYGNAVVITHIASGQGFGTNHYALISEIYKRAKVKMAGLDWTVDVPTLLASEEHRKAAAQSLRPEYD